MTFRNLLFAILLLMMIGATIAQTRKGRRTWFVWILDGLMIALGVYLFITQDR